MSVTLPAAPAALPADTYAVRHRVWWEQCDVLLRAEDQRQRDESEANRLLAIAASNAHAAAQQATADALAAGVAAQQAMVAAMNATPPQRLPTRAELVFEMVKDQPQATVLEKLFSTGTGSDASPGAMAVSGSIGYLEVLEARNL